MDCAVDSSNSWLSNDFKKMLTWLVKVSWWHVYRCYRGRKFRTIRRPWQYWVYELILRLENTLLMWHNGFTHTDITFSLKSFSTDDSPFSYINRPAVPLLHYPTLTTKLNMSNETNTTEPSTRPRAGLVASSRPDSPDGYRYTSYPSTGHVLGTIHKVLSDDKSSKHLATWSGSTSLSFVSDTQSPMKLWKINQHVPSLYSSQWGWAQQHLSRDTQRSSNANKFLTNSISPMLKSTSKRLRGGGWHGGD